jgi:hypothetical protein
MCPELVFIDLSMIALSLRKNKKKKRLELNALRFLTGDILRLNKHRKGDWLRTIESHF